MANNKQYAQYIDIPGGNGGTDRKWFRDAEAARKVVGGMSGNIVVLDSYGNIADSGLRPEELEKMNRAFPADWRTDGTMADLIEDIGNDETATRGKSYLATVTLSDLPAGLQQAEMLVNVMDKLEGEKTVVFTVTSSNTAPYHWEYTSAYGAPGTWRSFLVSHQSLTHKADKVSGSGISNHLAALNSNGNLKDSGKSVDDFYTKDEVDALASTITDGAQAAELFTFVVDTATMQLKCYSTMAYCTAFKVSDGYLKIDLTATSQQAAI